MKAKSVTKKASRGGIAGGRSKRAVPAARKTAASGGPETRTARVAATASKRRAIAARRGVARSVAAAGKPAGARAVASALVGRGGRNAQPAISRPTAGTRSVTSIGGRRKRRVVGGRTPSGGRSPHVAATGAERRLVAMLQAAARGGGARARDAARYATRIEFATQRLDDLRRLAERDGGVFAPARVEVAESILALHTRVAMRFLGATAERLAA